MNYCRGCNKFIPDEEVSENLDLCVSVHRGIADDGENITCGPVVELEAPEKIYLQFDEDGGEPDTWCQDKINDQDVEYIRFDDRLRVLQDVQDGYDARSIITASLAEHENMPTEWKLGWIYADLQGKIDELKAEIARLKELTEIP